MPVKIKGPDGKDAMVPIQVKEYKCLPDSLEAFSAEFINPSTSKVKNMNLFKRRILGLVSYFPDIDELLPKYNKTDNFTPILIPMSDFQFSVYEEARIEERKIEKNNAQQKAKNANKGDGVYDETVSTYRIFSRAFCNYVFPRPDIRRPLPNDADEISVNIIQSADEDLLDAISVDDKLADTEGKYEEGELDTSIEEAKINMSYDAKIKEAIRLLDTNKEQYLNPKALETYSPKFLNILSRLIDTDYEGLHLIYSQFRTLEGIGILSLVLKANGFAQFKIVKSGSDWKMNMSAEDLAKPKFVLYTGTEDPDEKEIIRNIFNTNWDVVPEKLRIELEKISPNNFNGEIIKTIMITASGAEGISLSNVRYVHITEPYWHPVRIEQVIGRARRICSHKNLPPEKQTVEVFLYLMQFSEKQLETASIDLKLNDTSKLEPSNNITSYEALYEISLIKENINKVILHNLKESSIDCSIHQKVGNKEKLQCFTFGSVNANKFAYGPSIDSDDRDQIASVNTVAVVIKLKKVKIGKEEYALDMNKVKKSNEDENGILKADVYLLSSALEANPIQIGYLQFKNLKPFGKLIKI